MTALYALQQIGVADGTVNPANRADGRQVNARKRTYLASKVPGVAIANGDTLFCFRKPAGQKITDIRICTDTSLGSSTIAIGVAGTPAKYKAAAVFTTPLNAPTSIGPLASTLDDDPGDAEDIILTCGAADIVAGTLFTLIFDLSGS